MAFTIVRVSSGGIPVVESAAGLPYYEADNGYGIPVTFGSTGIPLGSAGTFPLYEDFSQHADTSAGDLGPHKSPTGYPTASGGWLLGGSTDGNGDITYPGTKGFISSGLYATNAGDTVYASKRLGGTIRRVSGVLRWAAGPGAGAFGSGTVIISADQYLIRNCLHFSFARSGLTFKKITNRVFSSNIASIGGTQMPKDGSAFPFDIDVNPATGAFSLSFGGQSTSGTDASLPALMGPYLCAETFDQADTNAESLTRWEIVNARHANDLAALTESQLLPSMGTPANYSAGSGWNVTSSVAVRSIAAASDLTPASSVGVVAGRSYLIGGELDLAGGVVAGSLQFSVGGTLGSARTVSAAGLYSEVITATNTNNPAFKADGSSRYILKNTFCRPIR